MEKLGRFLILTVIYLLLVVGTMLLTPCVSWIFGGEFLFVLQHPLHVLFSLMTGGVVWGIIFESCFNSEFKSKK